MEQIEKRKLEHTISGKRQRKDFRMLENIEKLVEGYTKNDNQTTRCYYALSPF